MIKSNDMDSNKDRDKDVTATNKNNDAAMKTTTLNEVKATPITIKVEMALMTHAATMETGIPTTITTNDITDKGRGTNLNRIRNCNSQPHYNIQYQKCNQ